MAETSKVVASGNYSSKLRIEASWSVSGRNWSLRARMVFNTGTTNMGAWGCYGSTFLHTTNSSNGLAYTTKGNDYVVIDWTDITSGSYNSNGDAPTVNFGWGWRS